VAGGGHGRTLALARKLYGEPPPSGAPLAQRLRYVRRFYLRNAPLVVLCWALVFAWIRDLWLIAAAVLGAAIWLLGLVSLQLRIRREERR
jgi:hypothetical protein